MSKLKLYEWYSVEQATSFFGTAAEARHMCNSQWLIFPQHIACITEIGIPPTASHFKTATRFCWVADQPYRVNEQTASCFMPLEVLGSFAPRRPIHLFVRAKNGQKTLYVGHLSPSYVQQSPGRGNHGMAWFDLKPALPSSVWEQIGLRIGCLDFVGVDQALDRLHRPTTVYDRLDVLHQLVEYWHGPIRPEDGMSEAEICGLPLPLPLRHWYRWAGKRREVMSGQNMLFMPHDRQREYGQITVRNGRLFFYAENQGVYQWTTLPNGDDPPVLGRYEGDRRWAQEKVKLSEHLILACLFEAVTCHAKYGASVGWLDEEKFTAIIRRIPPIAIPPWHWLGMRFFAKQGAFLLAAENGVGKPYGKNKFRGDKEKYYSIHIGAKTEAPLQFLKPLVDDKWDEVSF